MPHFTIPFQAGSPRIQLYVAVSEPRRQALIAAGETIPQPLLVVALIDTGASSTAIDPVTVQALGLQPTGMMPILTPSTGAVPVQKNTFDVSFLIPVANMTYRLPVLQVFESHLGIQGIQVLIGRDVLRDCLFIYDGRAGHFSLAF